MAATRANASLLSAVTSTTTSTAADISTVYAAEVNVLIAITVTTATAAPSFFLQWSPDGGTTYYSGPTYTAGTAIANYYWTVAVPVTADHVKITFTLGTVGTSGVHTCTAQLGKVTGV